MQIVGGSITAGKIEEQMGWERGSLVPIAWWMLQEMSQGRKTEEVAVQLRVGESEVLSLIRTITNQPEGKDTEALASWGQAIGLLRMARGINENAIGDSWDALEARAVQTLSQKVESMGAGLSVKDALSIAQVANKAVRRNRGEGERGASFALRQNPDGSIDTELRAGKLGSIRLSLGQRVIEQLDKPKVIDVEPVSKEREMLTLEQTRKILNERG